MKKTEPTITVIVPIFNVGIYLEDCLESIQSQDYKDFEVILVDDGSTDESSRICKEYAEKDFRFIYYRQENSGVSIARNLGLKVMKGRFFTFIDGDDTVSKWYLSYMIDIITDTGVDIVSTNLTRVSHVKKDFEPHALNRNSIEILTSKVAAERLLYKEGIPNNVAGKLFSTDSMASLKFDSKFATGEDKEYLYRAILNTKLVATSKDSMYAYLQRAGSAMNSAFNPKKIDTYFATKKMIQNPKSESLNKAALSAKLFTEAYWMCLQLRDYRHEYGDLWNACIVDVDKTAWAVVRNTRVSVTRRLYAFIAIIDANLSVSLVACLLKFQKKKVRV